MQQGKALEMLGHAIEYLIDSRMHLAVVPDIVTGADAVRILACSSRELFSGCAEIIPVQQRLKQWTAGRLWTGVISSPRRTPDSTILNQDVSR